MLTRGSASEYLLIVKDTVLPLAIVPQIGLAVQACFVMSACYLPCCKHRHADIFVRHEIDLPTFATLTDEELKEIGIPTFGARKKLLALARETKKKLGVA